jgi:hypothetical protein
MSLADSPYWVSGTRLNAWALGKRWRRPVVARPTSGVALSVSAVAFQFLPTGKPSNNRGEDLHKWLEDDVVGNTPPLPPRLQILDLLVNRPKEHVWALKDVGRTQLRPASREFLRRLVTIVRHDDSLYKRVQLEQLISVVNVPPMSTPALQRMTYPPPTLDGAPWYSPVHSRREWR